MGKNRLEAFSDGVLAVIITIIVLEFKIPQGAELADLAALAPTFFNYVLSFLYVAIYWNNHHHMLHTVTRVNGAILWANLHLLFWLSLVPFATAWMSERHLATWPTVVYGINLLMAAIAYTLLQMAVIRLHGAQSVLAKAVGRDIKGKISIVFYLVAIGVAFAQPWISVAFYGAVAAIWLVPDRRIERMVNLSE